MIRAGKYDKRIRIERPSTASGAFGHRPPGWELVAEVWAAVRPMGSNERVAAFQMQSGQTHVISTGYQPALAVARGEWRMVMGARTFNIVGLPRNPDEKNEELVFDCTEGGADGH